MGDPVVKVYAGREVRFCCDDCIGKFEKDQTKYWNKVDEEIIGEQLMHYPLETCIVSGHELVEEGDHAAVNVVYDNRLVRLCCADVPYRRRPTGAPRVLRQAPRTRRRPRPDWPPRKPSSRRRSAASTRLAPPSRSASQQRTPA